MKNLTWDNKSVFAFILVFISVVILFVFLGLIYKKNEEQVWKEQAVLKLQEIADFKMQQIETWETDICSNSKGMIESTLLQEAINDWLINKDKEHFESIQENFQIILNNPEYANIFLLDIDGEPLFSGSDTTSFLPIQKETFQTVIHSGEEAFGDFYKNNTNGRVYLDIAFPVFDFQNQTQAVLVLQVDPTINLFSTITEWPYDSNSEEFILFEKAGDSVLFINKLKDVPNPALSFSLPLSRTDNPAVMAVLNGSGVYEGSGYHNQEIIEVINKIEDTDWYFAAKIDRDELFAPVFERVKIILGVILGLFLLSSSILFLIFLYRRRHFYKKLLEDEQEKNALKLHYEYVVKYANDIILLEDEGLNIVDANQRASQAYLYSLDELKRMHVSDLIDPEYRSGAIKRLNNIDKENGYLVEAVHQRKDGSLFDAEISARIITVEGKKFFHQIIRDITERKRNEKALMESEERFRTTLYSTGDAIITTNLEGKVQYVNKVAEELTGWTEAEASGKPVHEIFRVFSEETGEELENPVEKVLRWGMVSLLSNHTYLIHKDGKHISIGDSGAPIRDKNGKITGVVLVFRDLREERKLKKALEESELHYHSLTDNSPIGIFRAKPNGHITYVNPAWCLISGMDAQQAIDYGWLEAVHPDDREKVITNWQETSENENLLINEYRYVRSDEEVVFVLAHAVAEVNTEGEITGYVGTITDITERKQAEENLRLFRTLIDSSNDSIEIIDPETGTFIDVNKRGCKDLGYTREEILRLSVFDIDPMVTKSSFEGVKKEVLNSENGIWEGTHKRKDGSTFPVEVNIQIVTLDRDYMVSIARDITSRKQAEEILRASEEKFRSVYENSVIGIYRTTPDGRILMCNKKLLDMLGYSSLQELYEWNLNEKYAMSYSRDEFKRLIERDEVIEGLESELRRKDGSVIYVREYARIIRGENGQSSYYDGMMLDVTKQKEASDRLLILSKAVEQSPASTIITDTQGIIEYVNPKFTKLTGYLSHEVVGKHFGFLRSGEMTKEEEKSLWENINSGKEWRGEFHTRAKNGDLFWERVSISSIINDTGKTTHFIEVSEDITERKKAILQIRENERELASMVSNLPGFVYRCLNDKDWTMLYLSEKFEKITGYSADDFIYNKRHSFNNIIKKEYQLIIYNDWQHTLREKSVFEKEYEIITATNEFRWVLERGIGVFNEKDELLFLEGYIEDITERKKAEGLIIKAKELAVLSQEYSELNAEISSDLINVSQQTIHSKIEKSLTLLGNYTKVDRAYIFLFKENGQLMDNTDEWCAEGIHPKKENMQNLSVDLFPELMSILRQFKHIYIPRIKDLPKEAACEKEILERQDIQSLLIVPIFRSNVLLGFMGLDSVRAEKKWSLFQIKIFQAVGNAIASALYSVKNQNDLILAKMKAEESDKLKSAFLANMSHEIRTPMNAILGFMNLLNEPDLNDEDRSNFLKIINKSGERLLNTINDILEISKIEIGDIKLNFENVNILELLQYYCDLFKIQAYEKGVNLVLIKQTKEETTHIRTDKHKLDGILMNLLKNAIKFTNQGKIEFGCYLENGKLCFFVTDTGKGISKEKLDTIFDRFVQEELGNTRENEGSGIGLSIVKAYVELLNGQIEVDSEISKGSTFKVTIPYHPVV